MTRLEIHFLHFYCLINITTILENWAKIPLINGIWYGALGEEMAALPDFLFDNAQCEPQCVWEVGISGGSAHILCILYAISYSNCEYDLNPAQEMWHVITREDNRIRHIGLSPLDDWITGISPII